MHILCLDGPSNGQWCLSETAEVGTKFTCPNGGEYEVIKWPTGELVAVSSMSAHMIEENNFIDPDADEGIIDPDDDFGLKIAQQEADEWNATEHVGPPAAPLHTPH